MIIHWWLCMYDNDNDTSIYSMNFMLLGEIHGNSGTACSADAYYIRRLSPHPAHYISVSIQEVLGMQILCSCQ